MKNLFDFPKELLAELHAARHVTVLTGAGTSAESGVPTFRDAQTGLWAQYDPEELATPEAFQHNPKLVWDWYAWRRQLVARAEPNPGHYALVELEKLVPKFTLITQNVDSLHQRAGSSRVIELHGNISRIICSKERTVIQNWDDNNDCPRCPFCNNLLRPDVVWFGETLPPDALMAAYHAAQHCDVFLCIGTSGLVQPAASLPAAAIHNNIMTVEINPDTTPLSPHADYHLKTPSGRVLPALVTALKNYTP
ncbi:MAG: NAD-dependent protein deacylase Sir2 [Anaerolineae bacterium]|nr:NAD-dependent protein deacylase Sir2 [Anaerolineae bacterium]